MNKLYTLSILLIGLTVAWASPQVKTNVDKYVQSCNDRNTSACDTLGYMYLRGEDGVQSDWAKSVYYYDLGSLENKKIAIKKLFSDKDINKKDAKRNYEIYFEFTQCEKINNDILINSVSLYPNKKLDDLLKKLNGMNENPETYSGGKTYQLDLHLRGIGPIINFTESESQSYVYSNEGIELYYSRKSYDEDFLLPKSILLLLNSNIISFRGNINYYVDRDLELKNETMDVTIFLDKNQSLESYNKCIKELKNEI